MQFIIKSKKINEKIIDKQEPNLDSNSNNESFFLIR